MWTLCDKEHEARAHTELCVLIDKLSLSSTVNSQIYTENKCWVIGCQQNTVLDYELFKPSHVKSSQSQVMSKQVNSQMEVQSSEVQLQKSAQRSEDVHLAQQAHAKAARCSSCPRRGVVGARWTKDWQHRWRFLPLKTCFVNCHFGN